MHSVVGAAHLELGADFDGDVGDVTRQLLPRGCDVIARAADVHTDDEVIRWRCVVVGQNT